MGVVFLEGSTDRLLQEGRKIQNETIRKVPSLVRNITKKRLKLYGHVKKRKEGHMHVYSTSIACGIVVATCRKTLYDRIKLPLFRKQPHSKRN